jgi:urease accessory protein
MIELTIIDAPGAPTAAVTLPFGDRSRSRLRARLDDGREVAIRAPRGTVLRNGQVLASEGGVCVVVRAAPEPMSVVESNDARLLATAAYHLGNRHVALEIGTGYLQYLHDHVLDAMVRGLGLRVTSAERPFEPETGAYGGASHSHALPHAREAGAHHDGHHHGHG